MCGVPPPMTVRKWVKSGDGFEFIGIFTVLIALMLSEPPLPNHLEKLHPCRKIHWELRSAITIRRDIHSPALLSRNWVRCGSSDPGGSWIWIPIVRKGGDVCPRSSHQHMLRTVEHLTHATERHRARETVTLPLDSSQIG